TTVTEYLRELNWYYNGNKILNSIKHLINNGNKTLVINNITDEDIGEYSVRFDGLRLYHYNKKYEDKLLQLLRVYPVLSPLIFIVSYNGIHNTAPIIHTDVITRFSNESSSVTLTSYLKKYSNEGSVSLYHNGNLLFSGVTSGILGSSSNPHYNYTINHPSITDSGYYEFQFVLNPYSVLSSLNCPSSYQNFLTYSTFLGLSGISLDQSVQKLEYYETPHFNFSSNSTSFIRDYNAQLSCSVSGGYPLYRNITLMKNRVAIANSTESELVYITSGSSKYGLYQCAVDTTAQYIKKELLLEEEVQFTVQLNVNNCHEWNDAELMNTLRNQTKHSCRCSVDDVKFRGSDSSCSNNVLSFSSTMIYAAMDGSRTASDLVSILLYNLENNKLLWINNMTALSIASPSDDEENSTTNEGLLIGLFVAGFVACFVIVLPIFAVVYFWVKKHYKRFPHYDSNTEGDTVRYDNNKDFPQVMLKSKPQPKLSTVKMSRPQSPPVASEKRQKQKL
uniref:Ig-like domain-containing protein n=1 Tax=Amphimedon queenslandica TaxID=400682 RepID=A0A1X7SPR1_AMPQE